MLSKSEPSIKFALTTRPVNQKAAVRSGDKKTVHRRASAPPQLAARVADLCKEDRQSIAKVLLELTTAKQQNEALRQTLEEERAALIKERVDKEEKERKLADLSERWNQAVHETTLLGIKAKKAMKQARIFKSQVEVMSQEREAMVRDQCIHRDTVENMMAEVLALRQHIDFLKATELNQKQASTEGEAAKLEAQRNELRNKLASARAELKKKHAKLKALMNDQKRSSDHPESRVQTSNEDVFCRQPLSTHTDPMCSIEIPKSYSTPPILCPEPVKVEDHQVSLSVEAPSGEVLERPWSVQPDDFGSENPSPVPRRLRFSEPLVTIEASPDASLELPSQARSDTPVLVSDLSESALAEDQGFPTAITAHSAVIPSSSVGNAPFTPEHELVLNAVIDSIPASERAALLKGKLAPQLSPQEQHHFWSHLHQRVHNILAYHNDEQHRFSELESRLSTKQPASGAQTISEGFGNELPLHSPLAPTPNDSKSTELTAKSSNAPTSSIAAACEDSSILDVDLVPSPAMCYPQAAKERKLPSQSETLTPQIGLKPSPSLIPPPAALTRTPVTPATDVSAISYSSPIRDPPIPTGQHTQARHAGRSNVAENQMIDDVMALIRKVNQSVSSSPGGLPSQKPTVPTVPATRPESALSLRAETASTATSGRLPSSIADNASAASPAPSLECFRDVAAVFPLVSQPSSGPNESVEEIEEKKVIQLLQCKARQAEGVPLSSSAPAHPVATPNAEERRLAVMRVTESFLNSSSKSTPKKLLSSPQQARVQSATDPNDIHSLIEALSHSCATIGEYLSSSM